MEYGVLKPYALKDKNCLHRTKGVVHLQCDLVYNPLRASLRTIHPREDKVLEEDEKFDRKVRFASRQILRCLILPSLPPYLPQVMMKNIKRVVAMFKIIGPMKDAYDRIFSWQNKLESGIAFVVSLHGHVMDM